MKILILIIIFISKYAFATGEQLLLTYLASNPENILKCRISAMSTLFKDNSTVECNIYYLSNGFIIELSFDENKHKLITIKNTGIDHISLKIIHQDKFKSDFFSEDSKIFNEEIPIRTFKNGQTIRLNLKYNTDLHRGLDHDYILSVNVTLDRDCLPTTENNTFLILKEVFSSSFNELEIKKLFKDNNATISNLDNIKEIYASAYKSSNFVKSISGCDYKNLQLLDKIHETFPLEPYPLILRISGNIKPKSLQSKFSIKNHKIGKQIWIRNYGWGFHEVSAYLNNDDNKIYILDPFFEKDGVLEYQEWLDKLNTSGHPKIKIYKLNV